MDAAGDALRAGILRGWRLRSRMCRKNCGGDGKTQKRKNPTRKAHTGPPEVSRPSCNHVARRARTVRSGPELLQLDNNQPVGGEPGRQILATFARQRKPQFRNPRSKAASTCKREPFTARSRGELARRGHHPAAGRRGPEESEGGRVRASSRTTTHGRARRNASAQFSTTVSGRAPGCARPVRPSMRNRPSAATS